MHLLYIARIWTLDLRTRTIERSASFALFLSLAQFQTLYALLKYNESSIFMALRETTFSPSEWMSCCTTPNKSVVQQEI